MLYDTWVHASHKIINVEKYFSGMNNNKVNYDTSEPRLPPAASNS